MWVKAETLAPDFDNHTDAEIRLWANKLRRKAGRGSLPKGSYFKLGNEFYFNPEYFRAGEMPPPKPRSRIAREMQEAQ